MSGGRGRGPGLLPRATLVAPNLPDIRHTAVYPEEQRHYGAVTGQMGKDTGPVQARLGGVAAAEKRALTGRMAPGFRSPATFPCNPAEVTFRGRALASQV